MARFTISYRPEDANQLHWISAILENKYKEIPPKICLSSTIPGLKSRSFEILSGSPCPLNPAMLNGLPVWLHQTSDSVQPSTPRSNNHGHIGLTEISFGYMDSAVDYRWRNRIQSQHKLTLKEDHQRKSLLVEYKKNGKHVIRINQNCLEAHFITSYEFSNPPNTMILLLKTFPRCYLSQINSPRWGGHRTFSFGIIDKSCIARSSALCLKFSAPGPMMACLDFLVKVLNLDSHRSCINVDMISTPLCQMQPTPNDFWSSYGLHMLKQLGDRICQKISTVTWEKIILLSKLSVGEEFPYNKCYLKLTSIYFRARHNPFFDINQEYDTIEPISTGATMDKWVYVPRVYLTPYGIYPLPVKPMRGNRILREKKLFGSDEHFCRVIIRDVDLEQPQYDFMQNSEQWIKDLIMAKTSIVVANKNYEFLLFSNSQLRDRSFWFHSAYNDIRAEDIRKWMGDFSSEKCVGKRISRMGLSLTGTTATIRLSPNEIEKILDKADDHGRTFTDGIGKISPVALEKALRIYNPKLIEENYIPCALQIRLNGIKGVLVLAPDLNDQGLLIQYRPSQEKFSVNHNILEVVKHSVSGKLYLNRQVIVLLENMGIKCQTFVRLQNRERLKVSMSLLADRTALSILEQNVRIFNWKRMHQSGVQLTQEPFVRQLLLILAKQRLQHMKEKTNISISLSDGRMLMGVIDETNSLKYGQIFIQLLDLNGQREILKDRKVLVTKNPAHFPGDIRILDAIDCQALHHLYECIVFPAEGQRPHPNEISGSDLDGDEYWVCWHQDFVTQGTACPPAIFDSTEKKIQDNDITMADIADFLYQFLSSDSLGALSNRHLACCDLYTPRDDRSLRLAKIISDAVDFPKTGVLPQIPNDFKIDKYPDFMENQFKKSYLSTSSIGVMYREATVVWKLTYDWLNQSNDQNITISKYFLKPGYEKYTDVAKNDYQYYASRIDTLLSTYNLQNEYELITGCHFCSQEERQNNDATETALLEFRNLQDEMRSRFEAEPINYEERLRKASAWYFIAYKHSALLSFGWLMDGLMSNLINRASVINEEHRAWQRIGRALIREPLYETIIRKWATKNDATFNSSEEMTEEKLLGFQCLEFLKSDDQLIENSIIHELLIMIHKAALGCYDD